MKRFIKFNLILLLVVVDIFNIHAQSVGGVASGAITFCTGINSGFVSLSNHNGTIINWQSTTNGGLTWNTIANTNQNQTYFNLAQTTCYRAIVQDGAASPDTSSIVCITIIPASTGGVINGGGVFCSVSGEDTLKLSGNVGNVLFWLYSTDGGANWTTISNTGNWLYYSNIVRNTSYCAVVENAAGCPNDTSMQAFVKIDSQTVSGTLNGAATVCETSNNGLLVLSGFTGTISGWESSINNGVNWTAIVNNTPTQSYQNLTQSTLYRTLVKNGSCETDTSSSGAVLVDYRTIAGTLSGAATYCGTTATGSMNLTGYTGSIAGWASSITNGANWVPLSNTSATENYTNLPISTWYSVIVKNGVCPADTTNIEIVNVAPQTVPGTISGEANACSGSNAGTLDLTGNIGDVAAWLYSTDNGVNWYNIANTTTAQIYNGLTETTWYKAVVQSSNCAIDTTGFAGITIFSPAPVYAGKDTSFVYGQSIALQGTGTGIPLWTPATGLDNPAIFNPIATPNGSITYILSVKDVNSCVNSDTVRVNENDSEFKGMISNLFTPNGDGINDTWFIQDIQKYPGNEVFVYNIYGIEVFSRAGYNNDWKGTFKGADLPDGTYFYVIKSGTSSKVLKGSLDIFKNK